MKYREGRPVRDRVTGLEGTIKDVDAKKRVFWASFGGEEIAIRFGHPDYEVMSHG